MRSLFEVNAICRTVDDERAQVILFDLDGTLINSEPLHVQAIIYTLSEFDGSVSMDELLKLEASGIHERTVGVNDYSVYELLSKELGKSFLHSIDSLIAAKNDFLKGKEVLDLLKSPHCYKEEILAQLKQLASNGLRLGLVSASEKDFVSHVVTSLGWNNLFELIHCREDCLQTKPHPMPYLMAMDYFKSGPEETLIFEDSVTGLESACASGAKVIKANWY